MLVIQLKNNLLVIYSIFNENLCILRQIHRFQKRFNIFCTIVFIRLLVVLSKSLRQLCPFLTLWRTLPLIYTSGCCHALTVFFASCYHWCWRKIWLNLSMLVKYHLRVARNLFLSSCTPPHSCILGITFLCPSCCNDLASLFLLDLHHFLDHLNLLFHFLCLLLQHLWHLPINSSLHMMSLTSYWVQPQV